ncbi:MAG: YbhB/YbcL family Raf kinase inhibitor-like protein, partial [Alphaproteobacteria bacterium]|nr:YbhB/YbcL family Raf kinase inhibitor-like protein [Alphaproteobacteria bacterium]
MRLAGRTILGSIALLWGVQGASALQLESTEIAEGAPIAQAQVWPQCKGENISPALTWSGVPEGTKSFAVTVLDPGAMGGKGFWHWLIFNIPADARGLAQGAGAADGSKAPAGAVQGVNDFGTAGYAGPCPPKGDHPHR